MLAARMSPTGPDAFERGLSMNILILWVFGLGIIAALLALARRDTKRRVDKILPPWTSSNNTYSITVWIRGNAYDKGS